MQDPAAVGTRRSRIAEFLRQLDPDVRTALHFDDAAVISADLLISMCRALMDTGSGQPWQDRMESTFEEFDLSDLETGLDHILEQMQDTDTAISWLNSFKGVNYRTFALRLLGAADFRRLADAVKEDGAIVALAVRRGLRGLMPFAVAWSDAVGNMTENQRKAVSKTDIIGLEVVKMVIMADEAFGKKFVATLPMQLTAAIADDLVGWRPDDMTEIVSTIRHKVADSSAKRLERENSQLVRKIRGAKDALTHSEDGISQAANSLIELIDRIMREAFSNEEVMAWAEENLPDEPLLTHKDKDGKIKPTKRAEALCFVYRGGPTAREANEHDNGQGPTLIHDVLARVIVATRTSLQKFKHDDAGTQEEKDQLLSLLAGLEGALLLGLSISQIGIKRDQFLDNLEA
ncbi:hypothetical protein [Streptomyces sp. 3211]|uniref:hypothetical protein n=1 Tax=Streptomyces sp. 3211 TaxID=1964449 RepID=UPI0009A4D782|nr:hypothetical protein [Streptomyces sp. 3211]